MSLEPVSLYHQGVQLVDLAKITKKLEEQILITDDGYRLLTEFSFEDQFLT